MVRTSVKAPAKSTRFTLALNEEDVDGGGSFSNTLTARNAKMAGGTWKRKALNSRQVRQESGLINHLPSPSDRVGKEPS
jgi:hypothetical protein